MSSNLKVNTILPSTGTTVTVSGISSVTSSISAGSSITGTTFYGSGANLTSLPSQVTISNNADNRVITGGSGTNLNGESTLTYNPSILTITNASGASEITLVTPSANDSGVYFNDGSNSGALSYNHSDNSMRFRVNATEKLRIDSTGRLIVGASTNSIVDPFKVAIKETSGENAAIVFLDTDNMKGGICGIAKGTDQILTGTTNVISDAPEALVIVKIDGL